MANWLHINNFYHQNIYWEHKIITLERMILKNKRNFCDGNLKKKKNRLMENNWCIIIGYSNQYIASYIVTTAYNIFTFFPTFPFPIPINFELTSHKPSFSSIRARRSSPTNIATVVFPATNGSPSKYTKLMQGGQS